MNKELKSAADYIESEYGTANFSIHILRNDSVGLLRLMQNYGDYIAKQSQISDNEYQDRVAAWLVECFGEKISLDIPERSHRFLEEALELVQSLGCTRTEINLLVDYVYNRPVGDPKQEVGGVMVTLAGLCHAAGINLNKEAYEELERISLPFIMDKIRFKQASKPSSSPLLGEG